MIVVDVGRRDNQGGERVRGCGMFDGGGCQGVGGEEVPVKGVVVQVIGGGGGIRGEGGWVMAPGAIGAQCWDLPRAPQAGACRGELNTWAGHLCSLSVSVSPSSLPPVPLPTSPPPPLLL